MVRYVMIYLLQISVGIRQSYSKKSSGTFFPDTVYCCFKWWWPFVCHRPQYTIQPP